MHWRINNYLRKDRYTPTKYIDEKAQLLEAENGAYSFASGLPLGIPNGLPTGRKVVYTDKNSIDKDSKGESVRGEKAKRFYPPTLDEVKQYCEERKNNIDPMAFIDFYSSKGWMIGKNRMKDWKAAVRTWERKRKEQSQTGSVYDEWRDA